jgi:hypothetical protein
MKNATLNTVKSSTTDILNWGVSMVQEIHPITQAKLPYWATMRSDSQEILKTGLSKNYVPIQNSEIIKLAESLSKDFDIKTEKVEVLNGGKKIILQVTSGIAEIGHSLKNGQKDTIALRTTFLHDNTGSGSLFYTPSPFRLLCLNQLAVISNLASRYIADVTTRSIRHTQAGQFQLSEILNTANSIYQNGIETVNLYNKMAETKVNDFDIKEIVESMVKKMDYDLQVQQEIERLIFEADSGLTDPNSLWGVYNGVTRFHDHFGGRNNPSTNSLVFGAIAKKNTLALDTILNYMVV